MGAERRRFEPWPWAIAGALVFMIGTSLVFLRISIAHPDALVVHDSYASEPGVAERLRALGRAEAKGWRLAVSAARAEGDVAVVATLQDGDGRTLQPERVVVTRARPAEGGLDTELTLSQEGDVFRGRVPLPRPGRWLLTVRAELDGDVVERSLVVWGAG